VYVRNNPATYTDPTGLMTAGTSPSNPTETPGGDTDDDTDDSDDTEEQPAEVPDISLTSPEAPPQERADNPALPEPEVPGIALDTSPEGSGGVGSGGGPGSGTGDGGSGAVSNGNDNGQGDSGSGVSPEVPSDHELATQRATCRCPVLRNSL
jgi:hypothetical protein